MKEKKFIKNARAKDDGIIFYSNIIPLIGLETFRDNSGIIHSRITTVHLDEIRSRKSEKINPYDKYKVIAFDTILISVCLLFGNFYLAFASFYFSVYLSFDLFKLVRLIYQMKSKTGDKRSTARFHAATHMVINACTKVQRIPTLDEVKSTSRFSKNCGSRKIFYKMSTYSLIILVMFLNIEWNFLICFFISIAIIIFMKIADSKGWLRFFQFFVTSPPYDSEIELVIEGLKAFEELEEILKNKDETCIVFTLPSDFPFSPPPFLF